MPEEKKTQPVYNELPNSVESEQNLLCCIMKSPDKQLELISALDKSDFYQHANGVMFEAMKAVVKEERTVDFSSVVDRLRRMGALGSGLDIDYVARIYDMLPGAARAKEYLDVVKRAATMRKLISVCNETIKRAYSDDSAEKVLSYAQEQMFNLYKYGGGSELLDLSSMSSKMLVQITERYKDPAKFYGLKTGFRQLDVLTNGFHGGELIILAARPGVGKSAMAMNMVETIAKDGKYVAIYSYEMSNNQLLERLLSSMSGVPLGSIKSGRLERGEQDIARLNAANSVIAGKMHLYGNDSSSARPAEILSQCRNLRMQGQLDMIVVDYIGLMPSDDSELKGETRAGQVGSITRALKNMAKQLDVPVLALSQLKREAEIRNIGAKGSESKEPVLSDLRESGSIEQDADIVMFIHRDTQERNVDSPVQLIVAKHRNGETATIPLRWIGKNVRFVDSDFMMQNAAPTMVQNTAQNVVGEDVILTDEDEPEGQFISGDYEEKDDE